MDRRQISAIAHGDHPIAAPLSDATVRTLLDRSLPPDGGRVLDLGCGGAEWLVRALDGRPGLRAEGVDNDPGRVEEARSRVAEAGLGDRILLHAQDAGQFTAPHRFELVLSVGATHAFGGLLPTLTAARQHLAPAGLLVVGEGFWERPPGKATLDAGFAADEYGDLATTVDRVTAAGWAPLYGHVSTPEEWDDYEWSWTGTLTRWALDHPEHPGCTDALEAANQHRTAWLRGYRGTLGFVTLVLRPLTVPRP